MSGQINQVALPTYLNTPVAGSPATTAEALLAALSINAFNYTGEAGGTTPHFGVDFTNVSTLAATQGFFNSILNFSGPGVADGVRPMDILGLLLQAQKDDIQKKPITLTVTTNGSGVATINLTPYAFPNVPNVQLCCMETTVGQSTNAVITSKSTTSLVIRTYVTQNILLGIVNPVVAAAATVDILLSYT